MSLAIPKELQSFTLHEGTGSQSQSHRQKVLD
jgi:hypothetical protein